MESFGRLGEEGYELIDELVTHPAGGGDINLWRWKESSPNDLFTSFRWLHKWLYREEFSGTRWHYADNRRRREGTRSPCTHRHRYYGEAVSINSRTSSISEFGIPFQNKSGLFVGRRVSVCHWYIFRRGTYTGKNENFSWMGHFRMWNSTREWYIRW